MAMLVSAQSSAFLLRENSEATGKGQGDAVTYLHAGTSTPPLFVLTYMAVSDGIGAWGTVSACSVVDLLRQVDMLRRQGEMRMAHLLAVVSLATNRKPSRLTIESIDVGRCDDKDVYVFLAAGHRDGFCLESPTFDVESVVDRKVALRVDWYRHFSV